MHSISETDYDHKEEQADSDQTELPALHGTHLQMRMGKTWRILSIIILPLFILPYTRAVGAIAKAEEVSVSRRFYEITPVSETVEVEKGEGALGMPWYYMIQTR
ncbi:MAG: hypothetical protein WBB45_18160 [Cyclobacteriaceae bacterium]